MSLAVDNLRVYYRTTKGDVRALDGVTFQVADGEIMGMRHVEHAVFGVQFHPESILTKHGKDLLANFLRLARDARRRAA